MGQAMPRGQGIEDYSTSDSNAATVENDKGPKGLLAPLLNLDILPAPTSETTALESGDSGDNDGWRKGKDEGSPSREGRRYASIE